MKTIRVVAAVIKAVKEDGRTMIFATQRGYGEFKGGWEFPGGKIEAGETPQEALRARGTGIIWAASPCRFCSRWKLMAP